MDLKKIVLLFGLFVALCGSANAQWNLEFQQDLSNARAPFLTHPDLYNTPVWQSASDDSTLSLTADSVKANAKFPDLFLAINSALASNKSSFFVLPLAGVSAGIESNNQRTDFLHNEEVGILAGGKFSKSIRYGVNLFVLNAHSPFYVSHFVDSLGVYPGWGQNRNNGDEILALMGQGFISARIDDHFTIDAGVGKHQFGNGYRSLLLSDNSAANPYVQIDTRVWKLRYINLYSGLRDMRPQARNSKVLVNKFTTTHMLKWQATPSFSMAFFESIVWQVKDTMQNRGFDVNYLNPVIFYRPVEYEQGSADNALMGLNMWGKLPGNVTLYGQLAIDEFLLKELRANRGWWGNKFGFQLGATYNFRKGQQIFGVRAEYNQVRPFTYTHGSVQQNYGNMNQPIANPLGGNYREGILQFSIQSGKWGLENTLIYAHYGRDPDSLNMGGNLYKSYDNPSYTYGNHIGQGIPHHLVNEKLEVSYFLDRVYALRIFAGYNFRSCTEDITGTSNIVSFGIRTFLPNSETGF